MKLWAIADVEAAEQSDAWREAKAKADKRKANAAKAVATKTAKLEAEDDSDPRTAPDEVILRWMVNFIRHNLTRYDTKLDLWKGKTGISTEYPRFRNGVLSKIAEECRRQMI